MQKASFIFFFNSSKAMLPCCALHLFQQEDNEKWKTPVFIILAYPLMCVLVHWERKRRKTLHCILLASKFAQA